MHPHPLKSVTEQGCLVHVTRTAVAKTRSLEENFAMWLQDILMGMDGEVLKVQTQVVQL